MHSSLDAILPLETRILFKVLFADHIRRQEKMNFIEIGNVTSLKVKLILGQEKRKRKERVNERKRKRSKRREKQIRTVSTFLSETINHIS